MSKKEIVEKEITKETEAETTNPVAEVAKEETEAPKTETSEETVPQAMTIVEPEKPKKDGWFRRNWKKVAGTAALLVGGAAVIIAALGKRDSDDEPEYELADDDVEEISEESNGD